MRHAGCGVAVFHPPAKKIIPIAVAARVCCETNVWKTGKTDVVSIGQKCGPNSLLPG